MERKVSKGSDVLDRETEEDEQRVELSELITVQ